MHQSNFNIQVPRKNIREVHKFTMITLNQIFHWKKKDLLKHDAKEFTIQVRNCKSFQVDYILIEGTGNQGDTNYYEHPETLADPWATNGRKK